jgi:hypothetical protein
MAFTQHITVTNSSYTAVTAVSSNASQITVGEDPSVAGWPTTDFLVAKPTNTSVPRRVSVGSTYTFLALNNGKFAAGQVVGYIETVSGTTTFFQDEA